MKDWLKELRWSLIERYGLWRAKVCVVSYPKSGRTWLCVLTGKAICDMSGQDDRTALDWLTVTKTAGLLPTFYTHDGSGNMRGRHYQELQAGKSAYRRKKVLLLVRDPRDTVVSCYFQATARKGVFQGPISEFIRHDRFGIRKILTFYRQWEKSQTVPEEFLLLRYEDMHREPALALRAALRLMGSEEPSDEVVAKSVEFASFGNMRKLEVEGYFSSKRMRPASHKNQESFKTRKGVVGGYTSYLSPEDCAYMQNVIDEMGSPFYKVLPTWEPKQAPAPD